MSLSAFLEGKMPDTNGRMLEEIFNFSDQEIESRHDYIQWVFPLDEKSRSNFAAPVLEEFEIEEIRSSEIAQQNLIKSADWFFHFLQQHDHWIKSYDHNHLRITRVIKCLRLLIDDETADKFHATVKYYLGNRYEEIGIKPRTFWENA